MAAARSPSSLCGCQPGGSFNFCFLMPVVRAGPKPDWGMPCLALQRDRAAPLPLPSPMDPWWAFCEAQQGLWLSFLQSLHGSEPG